MTDIEYEPSDYDKALARVLGVKVSAVMGSQHAVALETVLKETPELEDHLVSVKIVSVSDVPVQNLVHIKLSVEGAKQLGSILISRNWNTDDHPEEREFTVQETRRFVEDIQELKVQLAKANNQLEHAERALDAINDVCQYNVMQSTGIVRSVRECVNAYKMNRDINSD